MREQRQSARREAEAARTRRRRTVLGAAAAAVVVVFVAVFVLSQVLGGNDSAKEVQAAGRCTWLDSGQTPSRPVSKPPVDPSTDPQVATVTTDQGALTVTLENAAAPCASASLASLASQGFYDDTPCHRLTTAGIFVLQCGDPTGTGTGGPGYQFAEENLQGATYPRGTVAMAKGTAPGTSGSQFFLVYEDSPLPPQYTPFGRITGGLDVLDKVAAAGVAPGPDGAAKTDGPPKLAVQITTLQVGPAPA